jgi:hypothetical protein
LLSAQDGTKEPRSGALVVNLPVPYIDAMPKVPQEIAGIKRREPRRRITKRQAVRHLIHAAVRMIAAAAEDPFAIHLIIQSADKLLIDLSNRLKKPLAHHWVENIKDEYRTPLMAVFRETYNFLKHADKDHDQDLHVGSITESNILQLAVCSANYRALYDELTDHMNLLFTFAKLVMPDAFVSPEQRPVFDSAVPKLATMRFGEFFNMQLWDDPMVAATMPGLAKERRQDLQDNAELFSTFFGDFPLKR